MPVEPIRLPGRVVPGGLRALMAEAEERDPERAKRLREKFQADLERLRQIEVESWRMLHGTTMGPYR